MMKLLRVFGIICSFSIVNIASVSAYNRTIVHSDGAFNKVYASAVSRGVELIYSFELPDNFDPLHTKVRVKLKTGKATKSKFPLLATILQTHEPASLTLPVTIKDSNGNVARYLHASRTLCIHADHFDEDEQYFEIRIATSSARMVFFELQVLNVEPMALGLDDPVTITISPTTPDYFYFQFPQTRKKMHVKVSVTSPYKKCAIFSIQPALCPVPERAENVRVAGNQIEDAAGWEWETITTKGAIVTSNKLISTPGFFVALLVTRDDRQCGDLIESPSRTINMTTRFTLVLSNDQLVDMGNDVFWTLPVYFPIALNVGILLFCGIVCIAVQVCCTGKGNRGKCVALKTFKVVSVRDFNEHFNQKYGERKIPHTYYGKMIIIIAMFFAIPVFELTIYDVTVLHTTGDNDICYYNSFCAHPLGYLKDFNHLWSNMGYITLGIGFMCITYLKNKFTVEASSQLIGEAADKISSTEEAGDKIKMGIPFKTGLYYAMGVALIIEGLMSGAYHICPNQSNFKYDTCFMFMIAAMCILKIFDFRHPRNLGPNGIFTILALFALLSASGIMMERYQFTSMLNIFKICLLIIHVYFIGFLSVYTLYLGYPVDRHKKDVILSSTNDIPHFLYIFPNICRLAKLPFRWHRSISVFCYCAINLVLTLFIWTSDFATLLLHFLISNLFYYLLHYVLVKFVHREFTLNCRSLQPLLYLGLTVAASLVAMQYFKVDLTEWRKSAAHSREGNGECILWNFYDEHDIWHMCSAVAILFLYMTLLTMDDGVQYVRQDQLKLI